MAQKPPQGVIEEPKPKTQWQECEMVNLKGRIVKIPAWLVQECLGKGFIFYQPGIAIPDSHGGNRPDLNPHHPELVEPSAAPPTAFEMGDPAATESTETKKSKAKRGE